jgi:acetolactate synthase I/II/III large subunit
MSGNNQPRRMTGGQALVECIAREGVRHVFNVPGESYLGALDAFYDHPEIRLITNRQEGGACYMAEAYGKATRQVGVCFVTRGPGATNASIGVHCAAQDSTPLVLFVGQVPRVNRGREAFQEIDYGRFFGSIAKWVVEVDRAAKIPEIAVRAFHMARSGRPGPVVVSLPEDMLVESADVHFPPPVPALRPFPDPALIAELCERVNRAAKPVLLAGAGVQYARARGELVAFAERFQLPVLTSWRRNDAFPNDHAHYCGNLALGRSPGQDLLREADLVLVVGDRLSEITTGDYKLPLPGQPLVQIDIDPAVIGRNFSPELAIVSDARLALEAALQRPASPAAGRAGWIATGRRNHEASVVLKPREAEHVAQETVIAELKALLPTDAILTVDAGNFSAWVQRFYPYTAEDSLLGPTVGSMGYGLPAAIGAKLAHPERVVVGTCGDGGFMMTVQELATAVQYGANIIQLVFNNSSLGTIRMHQERDYPERVVGTDLVNPDFAALARSYGALGLRVERGQDFRPALQEALRADKPAVLDIVTDKENLSVAATLSEIRRGKLKPKRERPTT